MISKLKKRFIFISVLSVAIALILIIGSINIAAYASVMNSAEMRLDILLGENAPPSKPSGQGNPFSPETPFISRYFTVLVNEKGEAVNGNFRAFPSADEDSAFSMAENLFSRGKMRGIEGDFAYRVSLTEKGALYVFLDHSRELDTFYSFLTASVLVCIFAMILVFILIIVFSKTAIRPIAESYEKQKRFITDAGHELKTPLAVIKASNEVIELEYGESRWTGSINNQVARMTELTNKLVLLSRMSEEKGLEVSEFSLTETLRECVSYFEAVEFSRGKEIRVDAAENILYKGDEKAIAQLFTLLTDNALKYSPEGSIIDISIKKSAKNTEISFRNPAENIPQGNLDILFERFYRPDDSRNSSQGGHGIGLSVANAIVGAHKGRMTALSPDGKSFEVRIYL